MSLKDQVTEDMKNAMRAKDSERLGTIRLLLAAAKQKEVDERVVLDDAAMIAIVDKLIKQRKDSVEAFTKANRMDLADKESAEIKVLQAYLPQRLNATEVSAAVQAIVANLGATGPGDMGKVMAAVKAQLAGKADMAMVSNSLSAPMLDAVVPEASRDRDPVDVDQLDHLSVSAWVEIVVKGAWQRSQLSWISPQNSMYLFTSVHGQTQSMTRASLEKMLTAGTLRVVSKQSMVDGALDQVVQTAMLNSLETRR